MKKLYFVPVLLCMLCFYACKKDNTAPQATIVGKWNMQKQNLALYIDGVKTSDSTLSASDKAYSYVQFNKAGSFIAISVYDSNGIGNTSSLPALVAVDTVRGTYSLKGSAFNLSAAVLGGFSVPYITDGSSSGTGSLPVIKQVSQSAQIMQLTSSVLTLHLEYTFTQTIAADTKTYKNILDYYYTK